MTASVFARIEKKYLLSQALADDLVQALNPFLTPDEHGQSEIRSLYLDTPEQLLIRRSLEKPFYKEKLRVRSYGRADSPEHPAFLELKKKCDGQVFKRRVVMPLSQVQRFLQVGQDTPEAEATPEVLAAPNNTDFTANGLQQQICRELAWSLQRYAPLQPFLAIHCQRRAYNYQNRGVSAPATGATSAASTLDEASATNAANGADAAKVRITFDRNIAWAPGSWESFFWLPGNTQLTSLLPAETCVMEIKACGGLPLELTGLLSRMGIFPTSFSKVGRAYQASLLTGGFNPNPAKPKAHSNALEQNQLLLEAEDVIRDAHRAILREQALRADTTLQRVIQ